PPPSHPPFPYTTLFRSSLASRHLHRRVALRPDRDGRANGGTPRARRQPHRPAVRLSRRSPLPRVHVFARTALLAARDQPADDLRSEEHTSELQSLAYLV